MDISTANADGTVTVFVTGQLNTNTARDLEVALDDVLLESTDIVLDFSNLDYISSAGLRVVLGAQKRVNAASGSLKLTGLSESVREVFDITGLADVLTIE